MLFLNVCSEKKNNNLLVQVLNLCGGLKKVAGLENFLKTIFVGFPELVFVTF